MIPETFRTIVDRMLSHLRSDPRITGVLAAGSWIEADMDEHSDIDLIVVATEADHASVMQDRRAIAGALGPLLSAFTAEHVGETRMLICMYAEPLVHVDLKFLALHELAKRIEDPVVLFDRVGDVATLMAAHAPVHPMPDPQWIEDRFWTWVHYGAVKLARGELFEVIDMLTAVRGSVHGPLALVAAGRLPRGVRRLERYLPDFAARLTATVATHDRGSCATALVALVDLYCELRAARPPERLQAAVEAAARAHLSGVISAI